MSVRVRYLAAFVSRYFLLMPELYTNACQNEAIALTREVVPPQRPDLVLSTDIPDVETGVLVRDGLDVESDGRDGVDFACGAGRELEGVEDGFEKMLATRFAFPGSPTDMRRYAPRAMFAPISALAGVGVDVLVFPAASRPSINRRISLLPKILARERESAAPMVDVL